MAFKVRYPTIDSLLIMIGAIIGDIIGSPYEHRNHKSTDFALFSAPQTLGGEFL
jgi:hypothetical protein